MKKHSDILFSILIVLSVLVLMPFVLRNDLFKQDANDTQTPIVQEPPTVSQTEPQGNEDETSAGAGETDPAGADETAAGETGAAGNPADETTAAGNESGETNTNETTAGSNTSGEAAPSETPTKEEFFSDVLFIGDSRTVGLMEYAGLDTANFFATSGMSSFKVLSEEVSVPNVGKVTLTTLFEQKSYGKIFLMLGINELGYSFSSVVSQYSEVVDFIRQMQPQATLYVCANLHLTASRSDSDEIYNNENINRLNTEIAALADNENIFYLDVNPLFDDENGALNAEYSADDTHPYGKYYAQWGQWIYDTCVQSKPAQ